MLHEKGRPEAANPELSAVAAGTSEGSTDGRQLSVFDALDEALSKRDDGQRRALQATHHGWRTAAERVIVELAESRRPFTSDDVTALAGHALGSSPNAVGSLMSAAARRGIITQCGFVQSRRAERRGGYVLEWVGTGKAGGAS